MSAAQLVVLAPKADRLAHLRLVADSAREYVAAARSERTRAAYRQQWQAFEAWCGANEMAALPAAAETVALYLAARANEGRRPATIAQALASISQAHLTAGFSSPRTSALVREAFKGIRRTLGGASQQKAPLLASQLRALALELPDTLGGARDRALLLVGFAGAFRRSELVELSVSDCVFSSEGLTITLRHSKTDQEGHGRKVGIPYGSSCATCPVRALQRWLELASVTDGALFRSVDRHGNVGGALSGKDVARVVKRCAPLAGLDPSALSGHSLRAGLATSAAKAGKGAHAIMKTTGHRSVAMVQRYVRDAELFSDNAAAGLL